MALRPPLTTIGQQFGFWEVNGNPFRSTKRWLIPCRCCCGHERPVAWYRLKAGGSSSCGCRGVERARPGEGQKALYGILRAMMKRCHNPANHGWDDYGGRGIEVCKQWRSDRRSFVDWALSSGYEQGLQIDRIDNDQGYSPENCRFVSATVNGRNKRNNNLVTIWGETKPLAAWIEDDRCVVKYDVAHYRLKAGWNPAEAIGSSRKRRDSWSSDEWQRHCQKALSDQNFDQDPRSARR